MLEVNSKIELDQQVNQYERVLALFASSHCPFCKRFVPFFDIYSVKCNTDLVLRVNMDDHDGPLWDEYDVNAVPTLILFENGTIKNRLDAGPGVGLTENQFTAWIKTITFP